MVPVGFREVWQVQAALLEVVVKYINGLPGQWRCHVLSAAPAYFLDGPGVLVPMSLLVAYSPEWL